MITFDCGGAATIAVTSQKELPKDKDTVIDGGGLITLDGGGATRILHFDGGDFRKTKTTVTLQHLAFKNAKSSGTAIPRRRRRARRASASTAAAARSRSATVSCTSST